MTPALLKDLILSKASAADAGSIVLTDKGVRFTATEAFCTFDVHATILPDGSIRDVSEGLDNVYSVADYTAFISDEADYDVTPYADWLARKVQS